MARGDSVLAIETFSNLEKRFEEFIAVVPYESEHLSVFSPALAGMLLEIGSLIEAIFKSTLDNARYNRVQGIAGIRQKRYASRPPYFTIADARNAFRSDQFYAKRVWYIPRSDPAFPWYQWRLSRQQNPSWLKRYNDVKHNRFGNHRKAKLKTVMQAMKGLFLVLIQSLEFREELVKRGIIRCGGIPLDQLIQDSVGWEPFQTPARIVAVSRIFGYQFLSQGSPTQATDISVFLGV